MEEKKQAAKSHPAAPNNHTPRELLNEKGNKAFSKKMYSEAIRFYNAALSDNPNALYLSNRANAHMKLK